MRQTKRALLISIVVMLVCLCMFTSTTWAWFTDEVTSAENKIQAGNLKVDLELLDKETGIWNSLKESKAPIFNYDRWEPGYVDAKILKIENTLSKKGGIEISPFLFLNLLLMKVKNQKIKEKV